MTERALEKERIRKMQMRIDYLEKLARGSLFSSDLLVSLGEFQHDASIKRKPVRIFQFARIQLKRLMNFRVLAFYLVDEDTADFRLMNIEPESARASMQKEIDVLIENGTFAWALNQNRPVMVKPVHCEEDMVLHVLATKARVRGMFAALTEKKGFILNDSILYTLSIVLQNTANSLESAALYQIMYDHNRKLETMTGEYKQLLADLISGVRTHADSIQSACALLRSEIRGVGESNLADRLTRIESAGKELLALIKKIPEL